MRISDWSSDVCSSDLRTHRADAGQGPDNHRQLLGPRGQGYFHGSGCVGGGALKALSPSGERVGRGGRMRDRRLIEFAKQMRREQTEPETRLWLELRGQRFQRIKFRRQKVIGDRKSTRRTPVTNAHLVCRLLLEKKK